MTFCLENFQQAVQDYTSSLNLLQSLHPPSSRSLASLHFQLGTVLDFIPNSRQSALSHVESALTSFRSRLADLDTPPNQRVNPELKKMDEKQSQKEKEEVIELIGDLEVRLEELKNAPEVGTQESIKELLGGGMGSSSNGASGSGSGSGVGSKKDDGPVNDLSGMVKKKKKPVVVPAGAAPGPSSNGQSNGNGVAINGIGLGGKREADENAERSSKKARVEDVPE